MKPRTHVAIILDKSGSMMSVKEQTITGFNEQVQQFKANAKEQDIFVSLISFNGNVYEHLWEQNANDLQEITTNDYEPNGSTAMLDAVGHTIAKYQENEDKEAAYLIIILSDGETNQDRKYNKSQIKEMITSCQNTKRWTFSYIGCSENYLDEVHSFTNIPKSNMSFFDSTSKESTRQTFSYYTQSIADYLEARSTDQIKASNFVSKQDNYMDLTAKLVVKNDDAVVTNFNPPATQTPVSYAADNLTCCLTDVEKKE